MARIRTIKPDFWTDEKVVELSPLARLLFIGLWNFADDQGRLVCSYKKIKLQILPADDADISALVGEIRGKSLVSQYVIDGVEYLQINGFEKHQKVDKRQASKLPAPTVPAESRRITPPDQGMDQGRECIKDTPNGDADASLSEEDLKTRIFGPALDWLGKQTRKSPDKLRPLVGKWCSTHGDGRTLEALQQASKNAPLDPVPYIEKLLGGQPSGRQQVVDLDKIFGPKESVVGH